MEEEAGREPGLALPEEGEASSEADKHIVAAAGRKGLFKPRGFLDRKSVV